MQRPCSAILNSQSADLQQIDGAMLVQLDEEELAELGVREAHERQKIMALALLLHKEPHSAPEHMHTSAQAKRRGSPQRGIALGSAATEGAQGSDSARGLPLSAAAVVYTGLRSLSCCPGRKLWRKPPCLGSLCLATHPRRIAATHRRDASQAPCQRSRWPKHQAWGIAV